MQLDDGDDAPLMLFRAMQLVQNMDELVVQAQNLVLFLCHHLRAPRRLLPGMLLTPLPPTLYGAPILDKSEQVVGAGRAQLLLDIPHLAVRALAPRAGIGLAELGPHLPPPHIPHAFVHIILVSPNPMENRQTRT
jgi:hypothetical protein